VHENAFLRYLTHPTWESRLAELAHHLASSIEIRRGPDRAKAVGGRGWHAAGATLPLPPERAAMRVRSPTLESEMRVNGWVAKEVVDDREPGAQAVG